MSLTCSSGLIRKRMLAPELVLLSQGSSWAGSSPQSRRGINVVFNYTHGYASFAMKAAISPDVPHNEGAFRPVHVSAPEGSILNCREPAAVASRHLVGHFLPGAIFGALALRLALIDEGVYAGRGDRYFVSAGLNATDLNDGLERIDRALARMLQQAWAIQHDFEGVTR